MKKLFLISSLLMAIVVTACKKNEPEASSYGACMQAKSPTPDELFNFIQGRWKLTEQYCGYCVAPGVNIVSRINKEIIFSSDSTVQLVSDDMIIPVGKFVIVETTDYPGKYSIQSTDKSRIYSLDGFLFTCGNKLGFTSAYLDGTTDIYTKQPN